MKSLTRNAQSSDIWNEYHTFTISLLCQRTYIELLITDNYLERWRMTFIPNLRKEQEVLREKASILLRQLKQAERTDGCSRSRGQHFSSTIRRTTQSITRDR